MAWKRFQHSLPVGTGIWLPSSERGIMKIFRVFFFFSHRKAFSENHRVFSIWNALVFSHYDIYTGTTNLCTNGCHVGCSWSGAKLAPGNQRITMLTRLWLPCQTNHNRRIFKLNIAWHIRAKMEVGIPLSPLSFADFFFFTEEAHNCYRIVG